MTDKEIRIFKALTNNKTIIAFSYIKPDFSNIDEVYTNNLNVWYCNNSDVRPTTKDGKGVEITNGILLNPDNVIISKKIGGFELTEIDFINSELKLLNECTNLNPIETKQFEYYKDYLNKKKINTEWTLNDYYNRYIETKQFYNFFTNRIYKNHEYNSIKDHLNATNERFKYILNRLNTEDKKELINDYKDQLTQLKSKQTQSKFIELINDTIQDIDINIKTNEIINQYKYNPTKIETIINFNNEDGTKNPYYYSDLLIQYKNSLNESLSKYDFDTDSTGTIKTFNKRIESLLIQIIKHYKNVNNYKNSKLNDFETYNYNDNKEFNNVVYLLETHATELLDLKLQNKDVNKLDKINQYYIKTLNQCLKDLNNKFEIDVFESPLKNKFTQLIQVFQNSITENDLKQLNNANIQTPQQVENNDVTKRNWFFIGLKFANGEMKTLLINHNYNASKIATELGNNSGYRPYISESIGVNSDTSNKSVYSDYNKMKAIIEYCKKENIEIESKFLMRFNELEPQ